MTDAILSYQQADSIKLLCEIDLKKLLPAPKQRKRFDKKWNDFLESDPCNNEIFALEGDVLKYQSEQLIPSKSDDRRLNRVDMMIAGQDLRDFRDVHK